MSTEIITQHGGYLAIVHRIRTILFAIFFVCLGNGLLSYVIPTALANNGVSKTLIGISLSMYAIGFSVGCFFCNGFINRVGHIRTFVFMASLISTVALAHSFVSDYITTSVLRFFTGLAMSAIYITFESWLNGASNRSSRGTILGVYQTSVAIGFFTSPWLLNLYDANTLRLFSLVSIMFGISLLPLAVSRIPAPRIPESSKLYGFKRMFLDSPSAFLGSFIAGLMILPLFQLMIVYLTDYQFDGATLSFILAAAFVGSFFFQVPVGKMADNSDKRKVYLMLLVLTSISSLILLANMLVLENIWILALCYMLISGAISCCYPLSLTLLFDQINQEDAVSANSSMMVIHSLGIFLGPFLVGFLMDNFGTYMLFVFVIVICVFFAVFLCVRIFIMNINISQESLPYFMTIQSIRPSNMNLNPSMDYSLTLIDEPFFRALLSSLTRAEAKQYKNILQESLFQNGMLPENVVLSLVVSLPRNSDDILRAMVSLFPDKREKLAFELHDLIALDKKRINHLLYKGLSYKSTHAQRVALQKYFHTVIEEERERM